MITMITPQRFSGTQRHHDAPRALMAAMLKSAVADLAAPIKAEIVDGKIRSVRDATEYSTASKWLLSGEKSLDGFCLIVGIKPSRVRAMAARVDAARQQIAADIRQGLIPLQHKNRAAYFAVVTVTEQINPILFERTQEAQS